MKTTPRPWKLFQLGPNLEYGNKSYRWIIVSGELGDKEVTGIVPNYLDAELIVNAVNNWESQDLLENYNAVKNLPEIIGRHIEDTLVYLFGSDYVTDLNWDEMGEKLYEWITYTFKEHREE